jgi:predicted nicotinamide N-methyase
VPDVEHYIAVCASTALIAVPLVPEIVVYASEDAYRVWDLTSLDTPDPPVPYWSFPWAGGQALARYLLDHPDLVRGRRVLDVASGNGLVAIAAAKAGAAHAVANDVDPFAAAAQQLNARANDVAVDSLLADILDDDRAGEFDVVLAGDVCYERGLSQRVLGFLQRSARGGTAVLLADPGRTYLPREQLEPVAEIDVPTSLAVEGTERKRTTIWRPMRHAD